MTPPGPTRFGLVGRGMGDVLAEARQAEELGFDCFGLGEHLFFHVPTVNVFVGLGAAAAVTERVRLVSAVALLPLYPPALVAKMGATIDRVSGGRFELGIGVGGEYPKEFEAVGVPVAERGVRADEAIEVIRRLWAESDVHLEGRFTTLRGVTLDPPPVQRPGPPLWVSGRSGVARRRAARWGDGWLPYMFSAEMCRSSIGEVRDAAAEMGRDPATIRSGVVVFTNCHQDEAVARRLLAEHLSQTYAQDGRALLDPYCIVGTPEQCRQRVAEYVAAGVDTILFVPDCAEGDRRGNIEMIAGEVVAPLVGAGGGASG